MDCDFPNDANALVPPEAESDALRAIVKGTAEQTGDAFFRTLVEHLARALQVSHAFVAEFDATRQRVTTIAFWAVDRIVPNITFELAGTPCEEVLGGALCHHPSGVQQKFPTDRALVEMGIESYLGVPLRDNDGKTLGHLAVFDTRPLPSEPRKLSIFDIFASVYLIAAAESPSMLPKFPCPIIIGYL